MTFWGQRAKEGGKRERRRVMILQGRLCRW